MHPLTKPFGRFTPKRTPTINLTDANRELQAAVKIARTLGNAGPVAIGMAVNAVKASTGFDLGTVFNIADASGVAVKPCYSVTEIAALMGPGYTPHKINSLLIEAKLQEPVFSKRRGYPKCNQMDGYQPTEDGAKHAVIGKNGRLRVNRLKWRDTVVEVLKLHVAN